MRGGETVCETPLEQIREDMFFRADNFEKERWYGDLQMYLAIGICKPDRGCVADLQKALKVSGYNTRIREHDGEPFVLPKRERQKQTPPRQKQEMER